jgi:hypothetical protein
MNHRVVLVGLAILATGLAPASTEGAAHANESIVMPENIHYSFY